MIDCCTSINQEGDKKIQSSPRDYRLFAKHSFEAYARDKKIQSSRDDFIIDTFYTSNICLYGLRDENLLKCLLTAASMDNKIAKKGNLQNYPLNDLKLRANKKSSLVVKKFTPHSHHVQ